MKHFGHPSPESQVRLAADWLLSVTSAAYRPAAQACASLEARLDLLPSSGDLFAWPVLLFWWFRLFHANRPQRLCRARHWPI